MKKSNIGSSFDDFLKDDGIYDEVVNSAFKKVLARQIENAMEIQHINKVQMAERMKTSRSTLDRLLDPESVSVNLATIQSAADVLGKKIEIKLV